MSALGRWAGLREHQTAALRQLVGAAVQGSPWHARRLKGCWRGGGGGPARRAGDDQS